MANKKATQKKAVKAIKKAVKKAFKKGVSVERVVDVVDRQIKKPERSKHSPKRAGLEASKNGQVTRDVVQARKLPGKRMPPTLTMKSGINASLEA